MGPLLLDANLAVLFVVGLADRNYIIKHKRLKEYDEIDFDIVHEIVRGASKLIFSPNVLTETSNLMRQIAEPLRSTISLVLASLVANTEERVVASRLAVQHPDHRKLGLTDAVLLTLLAEGATLLTVDLDLYVAAQRARLPAMNYNHVRDQRRHDYK